jgi:hypothetical protein
MAQDLRPAGRDLSPKTTRIPTGETRMREPKVWISVLILFILGLHVLPVLSYQRNRQNRWPILTWSMYAKSFPPGPIQTTRRRVVGKTSSGETEELTARVIGVSSPALGRRFIQPLWTGDSTVARELLHRLNQGRADPLVEVWVEGERFTLSDSRIVKENIRGTTYRFNPSDITRN